MEIGSPQSQQTTDAPSIAPPSVADHELLRVIGRGAYGEVWLARHTRLGTLRAIKIVRRDNFGEARPFTREFEGIQKYEPISRSHPNLVSILHVGDTDECFYYVMELADAAKRERSDGVMESWSDAMKSGTQHSDTPPLHHSRSYAPHTLRSELKQHGALPIDRCLEIGHALASALAHLHAHKLVHRDVKPSNVIFVGGVPKLADIGLVAGVDDARSFVGTEGYIPPEGPGTPSADCYSLGKLLYELSTGHDRTAWPEPPANLATRPDRERLLELNAILHRACAPDPRERYVNAQGTQADVELLQRGQSVKRKRAMQRRLVIGRWISVAAIFLILVFAGGYFLVATMSRQTAGVQRLSPAELAGTKNVEAYKKYEQGRAAYLQGNAEGFKQGQTFLREAVELDPSFLRAWEELFRIYMGWEWPDYKTQQRAIAKKLEQLSPNSAETHCTKAWIAYEDFEFAKADTEFQQAIQADPSRPIAQRRYGLFLMQCGRLQEARQRLRQSESLDPGSPTTQFLLGDCFFVERDYKQAAAQYEKTRKLAQRHIGAYERLGRLYEANGQILDAIAAFEKVDNGENPQKRAQRYEPLRRAFEQDGQRGYWTKRLEQAEAESSPEKEPYRFAALHARLGHTEQSLTLLENAWKVKDWGLKFLILDQHWDALRRDERFKDVLRKIGYSSKAL